MLYLKKGIFYSIGNLEEQILSGLYKVLVCYNCLHIISHALYNLRVTSAIKILVSLINFSLQYYVILKGCSGYTDL